MTDNYIKFLKSYRYKKILNYNERNLEIDHNFIQFIFPLNIKSKYSIDCPIINIQELIHHNEYEFAREKMILSLDLMLKHWGLRRRKIKKLINLNSEEKNDENEEEKVEYIEEIVLQDSSRLRLFQGHNAQRVSRVLQSLIFHKHERLAYQLLTLLESHIENTIWRERYEEAIKLMNEI